MANYLDIGKLDEYFEEIRNNNPTIDDDVASILRHAVFPMSVGQIRANYESLKGHCFPVPVEHKGIPIAVEFLRSIPDVYRYECIGGAHFMLYE